MLWIQAAGFGRDRGWCSRAARAAALVLLPMLGACAGIVAGSPAKMDGVRTIGIVSALGGQFEVKQIGLTVFNNDLKQFPIDSWGIDEMIIGRTRGMLARKFDVRPVTYRKAAFAERASIWNPVNLGDTIRAEASPQGLDAYLVIAPGVSPYSSSNQSMEGLGIVRAGITESLLSHSYVHALYGMDLVEGHQFTSLSRSFALMPNEQHNMFVGDPITGPHREVDQTWWPTSFDAASNQRLKGAVVELIDQSLPGTLGKLQLVN